MPLKDWNDPAVWDAIYRIPLGTGHAAGMTAPVVHYQRKGLFNASEPRFDFVSPEYNELIARFGWNPTASIAVIGCGFGWSIEYLQSRGYTDVWGDDPSIYIQSRKDDFPRDSGGNATESTKNSKVPSKILSNDLNVSGQIKEFLKDTGHPNGFDIVITERVLSSLSDTDVQNFASQVRDLIKSQGQVIHIETPLDTRVRQDAQMNWHTLAEWKTLLPADIIVATGGRTAITSLATT